MYTQYDYNDTLCHYGVKGMKWGVRHDYEPVGKHKKTNSQQNKENQKKKKNEERLKRALKIGAISASAVVLMYAGYKIHQSNYIQSKIIDGKEYIKNLLSGSDPWSNSSRSDDFMKRWNDLVNNPVGKSIMSMPVDRNGNLNQESIKQIHDRLYSDGYNWAYNLTMDELKAIQTYSSNYYIIINDVLRNPNSQFAGNDFIKKTIGNMDAAISQFELTKPTTFIRHGSNKLLNGAKSVDDIRKMIGATIHDDGFMSSSIVSQPAFKKSANLEFHISTPAGKGIGAYIEPIAVWQKEKEFLFARGGNYEITGVKEIKGKVVVDLLWKSITR